MKSKTGVLVGSMLALCVASGEVAAIPLEYSLSQNPIGMLPTDGTVSTNFAAVDADPLFQPGQNTITRAFISFNFTGSSESRLMNSGPLVTTSGGTNSEGYLVTLTSQTLLFDDIVDSIQMSIGNGAQLAIADDYGPPPYAPYRHEETQTINQYAPFHTTFPELVTVCDVGFTFPDGHSECYSSHIEVKNIPITIQSLVEVDTVTNITGGYDGTFSLELELSQAALDVFSATGDLPITYKVQSGGVSIDSATLSFDVGSNDVPEPGSLALLGMGLAGLGLSRRRKHDKPPYPLG